MGGFYSQMMGNDSAPRNNMAQQYQPWANPMSGFGGGMQQQRVQGQPPGGGGINGETIGAGIGTAWSPGFGTMIGSAAGKGGMNGMSDPQNYPEWAFGSGEGFNPEDFASKQFDQFANPDKAIAALEKIGGKDGVGGLAQQQYGDMQGVNNQLDAAGTQYGKDVHTNTTWANNNIKNDTAAYTKGQQGLSDQSATASTNLGNVYGETDRSMHDLQNRADINAGKAMSLKDAGNVNNNVQKTTRSLYNKEGEGQRASYNTEGAAQQGLYEQQAQGIGRQGLADTGVLAALGSQAMAGQMGGASPMTGGQMAAMQGANMSKAGSAYARAQQQMQGMRDQGMNRNMDMRNQGLGNESALRSRGVEQGFAQSDAQYGRGQQAQGMAAGMAQDRQSMGNAYQGAQAGLRGEQSGYQGNAYGANMGATNQMYGNMMNNDSTQYGLAQDSGARKMGALNSLYGPQMAAQGQMANIYGQYDTAKMAGMAGVVQGVGEIIPF